MGLLSWKNRSRLAFFVLINFFVISFVTKYADWRIYRAAIASSVANDGDKYKHDARQLLQEGGASERLHNLCFRPLYVLYLSIWFRIFGFDSDDIISVINLLLISAALTLLSFMLMDKYRSAGFGISFAAVVLFVAGNPLINYWAPFMYTEIPAVSMLILALYVYLVSDHKWKYVMLGGAYALAFHLREVTFINFVALILAMLVMREPKRGIIQVVAAYSALIVPWLLYVYSYDSLSYFANNLSGAYHGRKVLSQTAEMSVGGRIVANLGRHYSLYISDGGRIDSHGYYSIVYTVAMYVMGVVGMISLYVRGERREVCLVAASVLLTALFYGVLGEAPYMRGRVLVEYLLVYIAAAGFIICVENVRTRMGALTAARE